MDSLLEDGFASLKLNPAEKSITEISIAVAGELGCQHNRVLGKLLMEQEQDVRKIRATFLQSWGCAFSVERLQGNVFQFDFENAADVDRILADGPWCFSNVLMVLRRWELNWDRVDSFFATTSFWIQVWGIPLQYCQEALVGRLMSDLGGRGVCQLREEFGSGCRLFRFRASVDLSLSIRRFIQLTINGMPIMGRLRYERLPSYCFSCGKLDHLVHKCSGVKRKLSDEEMNSLPYYNEELKASRRTRVLREFMVKLGSCVDFSGKNKEVHFVDATTLSRTHSQRQHSSVPKSTLPKSELISRHSYIPQDGLLLHSSTPTAGFSDDGVWGHDKGDAVVPPMQLQVGFGHDSPTFRVDLPPNLFTFMAGVAGTSTYGPRRRVRMSNVVRQPLLLESAHEEPEPRKHGKKRKISVDLVPAESAVQARQEP